MFSEFSSDFIPLHSVKHQSPVDNYPSPEPTSSHTNILPRVDDGAGSRSITVPKDGMPVYIGRSKLQSDFVLSRNNQLASRVHAKLHFKLDSGEVQLQCLGSNGLFVRWPTVFRPTFLEKGQCCVLFRRASQSDAFVSVEIAGEVFRVAQTPLDASPLTQNNSITNLAPVEECNTLPNQSGLLTEDLLVSALVFLRKSSCSLHDFYAIAVGMLPSQATPIDLDHFREFLHTIPFIGRIERIGKDAEGKPLPDEYYYEIENDNNEDRREQYATVEGSRASLRSCRKKHKQYFWKKPKGNPNSPFSSSININIKKRRSEKKGRE